ncbi:MAG TPA: DNA replication/repair protein RecF [Armatimonadota bacterium]|jgi:DNA replication and repair protein RecF
MKISLVRLTGFRNYTQESVSPGPGANLFLGRNGQGKTNLLEAMALLSTTRSPRTSRDTDLVGWDAEWASVSVEVDRERRNDLRLEVRIEADGTKQVLINTVRHPRVVDLLGELNTTTFWVEDIEIVRGDPSVRRRFLNQEISQRSPHYCHDLAYLRRVLEHRNRLLKQLHQRGSASDSLSVWDEQLVTHGSRIIEQRRAFVESLRAPANTYHQQLTEGDEELDLLYQPSFELAEGEGPEARFYEALEAQREAEIGRGVTLVGPHRDEVTFLINGRDARTFGSLGQQRSVSLSLKLAEMASLEAELGEKAVLLMDDLFADLDRRRITALLKAALPGRQSFLVCTEPDLLPKEPIEGATWYRVDRGRVTAWKA